MQEILTLLHNLDEVYHAGSLDDYEKQWQGVEQQVQQILPGYTLAYAEIYNVGED